MNEISIDLLNEKLSVLCKFNEQERCIRKFENFSVADWKTKKSDCEKLILEKEKIRNEYEESRLIIQRIIVARIDLFVEYLERTYPKDKTSRFSLDPYEIVSETILSILNRGLARRMANSLFYETEEKFIGSFIKLMNWKRLSIIGKFSNVSVVQNTEEEDDVFFENEHEELVSSQKKYSKEIEDVNSNQTISEFENDDEQKHKDKFLLYYSIKIINQVPSDKKNLKPFKALQRKLKWQYGNDNSTIMKAALKTYQPSIIGKEGLKVFINRYKAWNKINH